MYARAESATTEAGKRSMIVTGTSRCASRIAVKRPTGPAPTITALAVRTDGGARGGASEMGQGTFEDGMAGKGNNNICVRLSGR